MKPFRNVSNIFFNYSQLEYSNQFCLNADIRGFHTDVIDDISMPIHPKGIALISTKPGLIDYIGVVNKRGKVASRKSRIRIDFVRAFPLPISIYEELNDNSRITSDFKKSIDNEHVTVVPYQIWNKLIKLIRSNDSNFDQIKFAFSKLERKIISNNEKTVEINGFEKDALTFLLKCSGFEIESVGIPNYDIQTDAMPDFLKNLNKPKFREDLLIINDSKTFDDWKVIDQNLICTTLSDGRKKLSIMYSNRLKLEETLGVDLIYIDDINKTMVLVQYKRLTGEKTKKYNPIRDKNYDKEMATIDHINNLLIKHSEDNYRYNNSAFYFKLCKDFQSVRSRELVDGMYIPLEYWKYLLLNNTNDTTKRFTFSYETVPNHFNNSTFTSLLKTGLIGCSNESYQILGEIIREIISNGHSVLLEKYENLTIAST